MSDDNDGQMIFGDLGGLKLPGISLTGEENPRKTSPRKPVPTGDRTRSRCVTGAHAAAWPTAVGGDQNFTHTHTHTDTHTHTHTYIHTHTRRKFRFVLFREKAQQNYKRNLKNVNCRNYSVSIMYRYHWNQSLHRNHMT